MKLKILFFGITTDLVNASEMYLEVEKDLSIENFKLLLKNKFTVLDKINSYAIAVNEEYANEETILKNNDVVAVIPPVSGG